jgi:hypothetical protein
MSEVTYETKLIAKLADELVEMHLSTGIELEHWFTALEVVDLFYETRIGSSGRVWIGYKKPRGF